MKCTLSSVLDWSASSKENQTRGKPLFTVMNPVFYKCFCKKGDVFPGQAISSLHLHKSFQNVLYCLLLDCVKRSIHSQTGFMVLDQSRLSNQQQQILHNVWPCLLKRYKCSLFDRPKKVMSHTRGDIENIIPYICVFDQLDTHARYTWTWTVTNSNLKKASFVLLKQQSSVFLPSTNS